MAFTQIQNVLTKLFNDTLIPGLPVTESIIFRKRNADPSSFDTTTGEPVDTFDPDFATKAPMILFTHDEISRAGGRILEGDVRAVLDGATISLVEVGDRVEWRGDEYEVIRVTEPRVNSTTLVWTCQLRK